ncbi:SLOG cluster 4 domain-containing protein [Oceanisphaera ostreae]|uniref:TIGR00725 family protein n=1 Tax=Oceanisphaera ostreae TaxID=914151 RepID=A0ABW3KFN9_9GAMM
MTFSEQHITFNDRQVTDSNGHLLPSSIRPLADHCWPDSLIGQTMTPLTALTLLAASGVFCQRSPVAVIGPNIATEEEYQLGEELGKALAGYGIPIICGGRTGIMEAVAKGASIRAGQVIGLLPDEEAHHANPWITTVIATGIGKARNSIIAQAAACLVAIGGSHGTMTEMAFGKHYDKQVFTLSDYPQIPGCLRLASVDDALAAVAAALFGLEVQS